MVRSPSSDAGDLTEILNALVAGVARLDARRVPATLRPSLSDARAAAERIDTLRGALQVRKLVEGKEVPSPDAKRLGKPMDVDE